MQCIVDEYTHFRNQASRAITDVRRGIRHTSWHHIMLLAFGVFLSILGVGQQVVSLNDWLASFPNNHDGWPVGGPFTVLISASLFVLTAFLAIFIVYVIRNKSDLSCISNPWIHLHGLAGGVCFAFNGQLVVTATPHVEESVQALLTASQLVFTLFFAIIFRLNRGKNYCHFLVITAILLSCSGIVVGTLASSGRAGAEYPNAGAWSTIFALGVAPGAMTVVVSGSLLQNCSFDPDHDDDEWSDDDKEDDDTTTIHTTGGGGGADEDPLLTAQLASSENCSAATGENIYPAIGPALPRTSGVVVNKRKNNKDERVTARDVSKNLGAKSSNCRLSASDLSQSDNNNGAADTTEEEPNRIIRFGDSAAIPSNQSEDGTGTMDAASDANTEDVAGDQQGGSGPGSLGSRRKKQGASIFDGYVKGETGFVKNLFLAESAFFQLVVLAALLPLDFAPWYGSNPGNSSATFRSIEYGMKCVFNTLGDTSGTCKDNALYYVLFAGAFAASNGGQVIISQFSIPLAGFVQQLASPLTSLVLVIFPSLAPKAEPTNVGMVVGACIMIAVGSSMFGIWEQMTSVQMREEEHHHHHRSGEEGTDHDGAESNDGTRQQRRRQRRAKKQQQQQQPGSADQRVSATDVASYGTLET